MTAAKKIFVNAGILILLAGLIIWFVVCQLLPAVACVPVPGSSLTMIVTADLAGCYDVKLIDQGRPVPGAFQCLGPYASKHCSAQTTIASNIVTIALTDGNYHYAVMINVATRQFVTNSI